MLTGLLHSALLQAILHNAGRLIFLIGNSDQFPEGRPRLVLPALQIKPDHWTWLTDFHIIRSLFTSLGPFPSHISSHHPPSLPPGPLLQAFHIPVAYQCFQFLRHLTQSFSPFYTLYICFQTLTPAYPTLHPPSVGPSLAFTSALRLHTATSTSRLGLPQVFSAVPASPCHHSLIVLPDTAFVLATLHRWQILQGVGHHLSWLLLILQDLCHLRYLINSY